MTRLLVEYVGRQPGDLLSRVDGGLHYLRRLRDEMLDVSAEAWAHDPTPSAHPTAIGI